MTKNEVNNFSERSHDHSFVGSAQHIFHCIYIEFSVPNFFLFLTFIFSFN